MQSCKRVNRNSEGRLSQVEETAHQNVGTINKATWSLRTTGVTRGLAAPQRANDGNRGVSVGRGRFCFFIREQIFEGSVSHADMFGLYCRSDGDVKIQQIFISTYH